MHVLLYDWYVIKMKLFQIFIISIFKYTYAKSESLKTCGTNLRMVNAKFIFEETLNTRVGITNGKTFLNDFLNHPRFVKQSERNCVNACLRHPDCFAMLSDGNCEIGLNTASQGRIISNREKGNTFIRMDAFVNFIEDISVTSAFNKTTFTSSRYHDIPPSRAVDGNYNPVASEGSCTHILDDNNEWWAVDLGANYVVYAVSLVNRQSYTYTRLSNFNINVAMDAPTPLEATQMSLCAHFDGPVGRGAHERIDCVNPVRGRYVSIMRDGIITLCEVEVFAVKQPN